MRTTEYWSVAFRNIRRQPLRTTLTLSALVLSTCVMTLMAGISLGGYQAMYRQFGSSDALQTVAVTQSQSQSSLSPFGDVTQVGPTKVLDDSVVDQLAHVTYVTHADPRAAIWELASFAVGGSAKHYTLQANGVPYTATIPLAAGAGFASNDDQNKVILGYDYAKSLAIDPAQLVGKAITITTQPGYRGIGAIIPSPTASKQQVDTFNANPTLLTATVVGVTQSGPNQNLAFIPLGWAHQIRTIHYYDGDQLKTTDQLARDGYSSIQLSVDSLSHVQFVVDTVKSMGYGVTSLLSTVQQLNQLLAIVTIVLGLVAVIALLAATLGVINTMLMTVSEQTFEIGIWRACGATKGTILRIFIVESMLLGIFGGTIGIAVSSPLAATITHYSESLLVSQGLQSVNLVVISPVISGGAVIATVIFCMVAGLYPAFRAARVDPSRALSSL